MGEVNQNFFACDPVDHFGQTNTWFTPKYLIDRLGPFDLDPCSQSRRPFDTALRHYLEDKGEDGLSMPWDGRVWLNPPYGKFTARWLGKLAHHGNGIALVFARTESAWAQSIMPRCDAVNLIAGRVSFLRADGSLENNAGTGSMLLAFGRENAEAIARIEGVVFAVDASVHNLPLLSTT